MRSLKFDLWLPATLSFAVALGCATTPRSESPAPTAVDTAAAGAAAKSTPAGTDTTALSQAAAATAPDVTCTKGNDTRVLEIEEVRSGCWLFYINRGIKKRMAWSKAGKAHCEKVREQIRTSLVKGGYQCKGN